jgi:exonuclease SbcC
MLVRRLYLQNYRVFEDPVEIELPGGLVGIYGPNGAGKSTLLEAIRFALFGKARTPIPLIRTAGTGGDCVAEVTFEHEGHLYVVRRSVTGAANTTRARAEADGAHVAEGVRDVERYVRSVLGMDDDAFRASVFAEQKQVAAFSAKRPEDRRGLVLGLLGITPLEKARDAARRDGRSRREAFERAVAALGDLGELGARVAAAEEDAAAAEAAAAEAAAGLAAAEQALAAATAAFEAAEDARREHERVVADGKAARERHDAAHRAVLRLEEELAALDALAAQHAAVVAEAAGLEAAEARLAALDALAQADERLAAAEAALAVAPTVPLAEAEARAVAARAAAADAGAARAAAEQAERHAASDLERATAELARVAELTGAAHCPLCGQPLGDAFEAVRRHREAEREEAAARLAAARRAREEAERVAAEAAAGAAAAERELREAQEAHRRWAAAVAVRDEAARARDAAAAALNPPAAPGEREAFTATVRRKRSAAREAAELAGRLKRRGAAEAELADQQERVAKAAAELADLREQLRSVGFDAGAYEAARAARDDAAAACDRAREASAAAASARAGAEARLEAARAALAEAEAQRRRVEALGREAGELERVGALLHAFRNELVTAIGPALSSHAAALFAELTDGEYEGLEVDPDDFAIRLVDGGVAYDLSRFSGSETDLANLALRVAISEHVRFQTGGQVGLLVLDEVFGPLDAERKERMLSALERLRARFRQVLVVTHDVEIKDRLPNALEVEKLPGRRATLRWSAGVGVPG